MDGVPFDDRFDNDHLGTQMQEGGAVHTITVTPP
jgi:hypothetical protein